LTFPEILENWENNEKFVEKSAITVDKQFFLENSEYSFNGYPKEPVKPIIE